VPIGTTLLAMSPDAGACRCGGPTAEPCPKAMPRSAKRAASSRLSIPCITLFQ